MDHIWLGTMFSHMRSWSNDSDGGLSGWSVMWFKATRNYKSLWFGNLYSQELQRYPASEKNESQRKLLHWGNLPLFCQLIFFATSQFTLIFLGWRQNDQSILSQYALFHATRISEFVWKRKLLNGLWLPIKKPYRMPSSNHSKRPQNFTKHQSWKNLLQVCSSSVVL